MQHPQSAAVQVMGGGATGMFGVVDGVGDELADMVVLESVEHLRALAPGAHEPGHPQFRKVLGHRRCGLLDVCGQVVDRQLAIGESPQQLHAGGVGEHPEDLDDEIGLFVGQPPGAEFVICIHTQIVALQVASGRARSFALWGYVWVMPIAPTITTTGITALVQWTVDGDATAT